MNKKELEHIKSTQPNSELADDALESVSGGLFIPNQELLCVDKSLDFLILQPPVEIPAAEND